jgi:hypothetical protein
VCPTENKKGETHVENDVSAQLAEAKELLATLKEVQSLYEALPCADDLDGLRTTLAGINGIAKEIVETANGEHFPTADDFDELADKLQGIRESLASVGEAEVSNSL